MKTIDGTATLADLLADPGQINALEPEQARRMLPEIAALALVLSAKAAAGEPAPEAEQVLTLKETCAFLRVSPDSLYRGWKKLGLGYRDPLSGKLRFLKSTLERYLTRSALRH